MEGAASTTEAGPGRNRGVSTGALAFPGDVWGDVGGERHSHYKAKGRRTAIRRKRPRSPSRSGAKLRTTSKARWMERGNSPNHRATIPILAREFGSEPPSGPDENVIRIYQVSPKTRS